MKKWTIVLTSMLMTLMLGSLVYAQDDVDIYDKTNEGILVVTFSTMDINQKNSPVENVTIELLYDNGGEWINIYDLEDMKDSYIDLSSDYNGTIVLNNLPYGMYQYKIISAPDGYEYDTDSKIAIVDILNNYLTLEEILTKKIDMAEGTVDKEDKKDDIVIEEPVIETPIETIPEPVEEVEYIKSEIVADYTYEENEKVEDKKEIKNTNTITITKEIFEEKEKKNELDDVSDTMNEALKNRKEKIKRDMLKSFRAYKFVDAIKDAIATIENPMDTILKAISNIPKDDDNTDEEKKRKRLNMTIGEVISDNKEKRYNNIEKR